MTGTEHQLQLTITGKKGAEVGQADHETLKYSLLGPSLLKAGQDVVDQAKVSDIIYSASKGSKFFDREEARDKALSSKIEQILAKKAVLERSDMSRDLRLVDNLIAKLDASRDLSQHIVHVDCDAFYAAVELLRRPELKDTPFAVGSGVLSTCNYLARSFGCRSGMAGFVAKKLCPELVILKPDFVKYSAKAQEVRRVLARYDPRFESASIDEAYLNVTEYCTSHEMTPSEAVAQLRREISEETSVTVSAGIAANARLAKICSNINKPDGQFVLPHERPVILEFMENLACRKVNGIGRVFERELASVGIKTCGDIYGQRQFLGQLFGDKACHFLIHCYLGLGRTSVQPAGEYERKSVGTESTFASISDPETINRKLEWTAHELERDLRQAECKGRTLVLKLKLDTFEIHTRQVVLSRAIDTAHDLYEHALPMLVKLGQEIPGMCVRLLGLRCTHLTSTRKPDALSFFGIRSSHDTGQPDTEAVLNKNISDNMSEGGLQPQDDSDDNVLVQYNNDDFATVPRTEEDDQPDQEVWWHCPVCFQRHPSNERQFNEHVDFCLSRRAILEAVQEHASGACQPDRNSKKNSRRPRPDKRRGKPAAISRDPRQKKICFETP